MMNNLMLVGTLLKEVKIIEIDGKKKGIFTILCPRSYKTIDGIYGADIIDITCWNGIADNIKEHCKVEDTIGVKGRVETTFLNDGTKITEIVAEKVSFLASRKENENE